MFPLRKKPKQKIRRRSPRRLGTRLQIECLEARTMFDGNGLLLSNEAYLTLSFAADGTSVAGQSNALAAKFNAIAPQNVWTNAILQAFQTWALRTNADIGVVVDGGQALGTPGPTRGDSRFGDIRIAAIGMDPLIGGTSTPIDRLVGGTWKADVIFNTNFNFQSVSDIYEVALHEAGHVFGLEDNNDPNSPLHSGTIPTATVPTAQDTANLQLLYGTRLPDFNETDRGLQNNDSLSNATVLVVPSSPTVTAGSVPVLTYGDITSSNDLDFFRLKVPDNYSGSLNVQVRSAGISLLTPWLRVYDENHSLISDVVSSCHGGDTLTFSVPNVAPNAIYFLEVAGATTDVFGLGGYALKATFPDVPQADLTALAPYHDQDLRKLSQDEIRKLVVPSEDHFLNDDGHVDDTITTATAIQEQTDFTDPSRFEVTGSISDNSDVDFYHLRAPQNVSAPFDALTVSINTLSAGRLVPKVRIFDRNQVEMAVTVLANGSGELVVQVAGIESNRNYFIEVSASESGGPFNAGNYRLTASFRDQLAAFQTFASGTVEPGSTQNEHTLYVAQPQLFHFLLQAQAAQSMPTTAIVATIYDSTGNAVYRISSGVGQIQSQGAVLLAPGTYKVRFSSLSLQGPVTLPITYTLTGQAISDPFASDPNDQTTNPFINPDPSTGGAFVYPGNIHSNDPSLWDNFVNTLPSPPPPDVQTQINLLIGNWWSWFWLQTGVNGPPLAQTDIFSMSPNAVLSVSTAIGLLQNDFDPDADPMVTVLSVNPSNGSLTLNSDGSFQFQPAPNFNGMVRFTYQTSDFRQLSSPSNVYIAVGAVADYDHDGLINQNDYSTWNTSYGVTGSANGDGNANGTVDASDFVMWRKTRPPAAGAALALTNAQPVATSQPLPGTLVPVVAQPASTVQIAKLAFAPDTVASTAVTSSSVSSQILGDAVTSPVLYGADSSLLLLAAAAPANSLSGVLSDNEAAIDSAFEELAIRTFMSSSSNNQLTTSVAAPATMWESL